MLLNWKKKSMDNARKICAKQRLNATWRGTDTPADHRTHGREADSASTIASPERRPWPNNVPAISDATGQAALKGR
jgi:hypothetical protein